MLTEDQIILNGIARGDRNALRKFMERYYGPLCVYASRLLGNADSAEDIVQDAFVHIWVSRNKLGAVISPGNYVYGIVRNRCMLALRSSRHHDKYIRGYSARENDFVSEYIETETMRLLYDAIERLPTRSSEVIRLSLEGLCQEAIADRMEIALVTVKVLKADGVRKLRKMLAPTSFLILWF